MADTIIKDAFGREAALEVHSSGVVTTPKADATAIASGDPKTLINKDYLDSIKGVQNEIATLDANGKLENTQMPEIDGGTF